MDGYTTLQASFPKRAVDNVLLVWLCFYGDMAKTEILPHRKGGFATPEPAAENAEEDVLEERLYTKR